MLESSKTARQLERELGIGKTSLSRWKRELEEKDKHAFPGQGRVPPEQEQVQKLERQVAILRQERDILKKKPPALRAAQVSGHLCAPKSMRFQFIKDHRDEFPVVRMHEMLGVSRSGYYAWRNRPVSAREMVNQELYKEIKAVYNENHGIYGSPRITAHSISRV